MAIPRATPEELIDVRPLSDALPDSKSITLMRSDHLEVVRLVLPACKCLSAHERRSQTMGFDPGTAGHTNWPGWSTHWRMGNLHQLSRFPGRSEAM